jgi:endonuclease III
MTSHNSSKMKASDRQVVIRRVTALLQKRYGRSQPKEQRDVLHTLLFAITLENASHTAAETALTRLIGAFHDLNEIRVSSITEIESLLKDVPGSDWKALRIREALQYTFEKHYSFDLDALKRKTMDLAEKQLAKVSHLTPFARNYVLQHSLGSHVIPVDDATRDVVHWLGLAPKGAGIDATADEVKAAVRKQDAPAFCFLLRQLVTDVKYAGTFTAATGAGDDGDADGAAIVERFKRHLAHPPKVTKKTVKKSHKRPPVATRAAKRGRSAAPATVRKRVSKPKATGGQRRTRR